MKKALPADAKILTDANETIHECVSKFINFITGTFESNTHLAKIWNAWSAGFKRYDSHLSESRPPSMMRKSGQQTANALLECPHHSCSTIPRLSDAKRSDSRVWTTVIEMCANVGASRRYKAKQWVKAAHKHI